MKDVIKCEKCIILEKDIENIKKDVEEMRVDMKVFQRVSQDLEIKFNKIETLFNEKFLQITDKLDNIVQRMDKDTENRKNNKLTFLGQFVYPVAVAVILLYLTYKINK